MNTSTAPSYRPPDERGFESMNYTEELRSRMIPFRDLSKGAARHQRLPICGHVFRPSEEPRHRNCDACWFVFFNLHKDLVESCDEVFRTLGETALRKIRGPKFAKNYFRFMSTIAQWKEAASAAKENNEIHTSTTSGSNRTADSGDSEGAD